MTFDRNKWQLTLKRHYAPSWPCPRCGKGILKLKKDSMNIDETVDSRYLHLDLEMWTPIDVEKRFSCLLMCNYNPCKEVVVMCGNTEVVPYKNEFGGYDFEDELIPLYMEPSLQFFEIPAKCPKKVQKEIRRAFSLFLCDISASANRVRSAVELLLDSLKVKRRTKTGKGITRVLSIHERIKILELKEPELGQSLLAIKWLGNVGSHTKQLSREDIFDAFEIFSHTIDELYFKRSKRVAKMAREIIRRRGPRKR